MLMSRSVGTLPDLNDFCDGLLILRSGALLQIDKLARLQANLTISGTYLADNNSTLVIGPAGSKPGVAITYFEVNGTDWLSQIAQRADIVPSSDFDFRLYPTDLEQGNKRAFRAVIQDMDAPADAGTPTCITWQQTVDVFRKVGLPLDEFVFEFGDNGIVKGVESMALGTVFTRSQNNERRTR